MLVFNQQSDRDATDMLRHVHQNLVSNGVRVKLAVFCTNVTYKDASTKPGTENAAPFPFCPRTLYLGHMCVIGALTCAPTELANSNVDPDVVTKLTLQNTLAEAWRALEPGVEAIVAPSIEEAVESLEKMEGDLQVFVTGSFHLVGGALSVLEGEDSGLKPARR